MGADQSADFKFAREKDGGAEVVDLPNFLLRRDRELAMPIDRMQLPCWTLLGRRRWT